MVERFVGLDVSQWLMSVCILDERGGRVWRGKCATDPAVTAEVVRVRAGGPARLGSETGPLTPWLMHELRSYLGAITSLAFANAVAAMFSFLTPARTRASSGHLASSFGVNAGPSSASAGAARRRRAIIPRR